MKNISLLIIVISCAFMVYGQKEKNKDKCQFKKFNPEKSFYYNTILKDINENKEKSESREYLSLDFDKHKIPKKIDNYKTFWHTKPESQGSSGTCWCYSATSFMESEIKRINNIEINLSEMFTVYWEYVERAAKYVDTRGNISFSQGSEASSIPIIYDKYGIVTKKDYPGKLNKGKFHNHAKMVEEMKSFLESVKESNSWNKKFVVETIKSILKKYMGTPPKMVKYNGKEYSPKAFLNEVCKLKMIDYVNFMSLKKERYNEKHELVEKDNWREYDEYYNVSLNDYMSIIKNAIENGYTISICGDISEPGRDSFEDVAIVPDFDIPSEYINEDSRQYRLSNETTTDDHCIQIVGYQQIDGKWWFLMKDSGASGFSGEYKGYAFYHEDYIKLKMMNILLHKNAAKSVLDEIIK